MMKKIVGAMLGVLLAGVGAGAARAGDEAESAAFKAMMGSSFQAKGIATLDRLQQDDVDKACSAHHNRLPMELQKTLMAEQEKLVKLPADGKYLGDWKAGEKLAQNGKGMTWSDKADEPNGGNCYACHQLDPKELSHGTIGPSLYQYGKQRGSSEESLKYTWTKIYDSKAVVACSNMPRFGQAGILTEQQIKDVMALLFDPESPVNK